MINTLKTHNILAAIAFLTERNKKVHIIINWSQLNKFDGLLNSVQDTDNIQINISPAAITNFSVESNKLFFLCRFNGISTDCIIPTAAISAIFDPETAKGILFDVIQDGDAELADNAEFPPVSAKKDFVRKAAAPAKKVAYLHLVK